MKYGLWNITRDLLLLVLTLYLLFGGRMQFGIGTEKYVDRDTTMFVDTIPFYYPVPRDSVITRYVTVSLPVREPCNEPPQLLMDSAEVEIPVTQKIYGDSTYRAYVSGYNPRLDSIFVYPKTVLVSVRQRPKRWSLGVGPAVGIGRHGIEPGFVLSLQYKLFEF